MKICKKGHGYEPILNSDRGCLECRRLYDRKRYNNPERRKQVNISRIKYYKTKYKPHVQYKKDKCGKCNFIPIHSIQLDVDHIDGNHKNNEISNLQTLCANCHRLKTLESYRKIL